MHLTYKNKCQLVCATTFLLLGLTGVGTTATQHPSQDWWSLKRLILPTVPKPKNAQWVKSPLDAFVLSELEKRNLKPAPPADKRTLIRRATFDLTGLPATLKEIDAFLKDKSPGAFETVIDRLLKSPHYGERWGRHWLDVARFSESHGFEYDRIRDNAWPYRDYVIQSFNHDKPYNEFIREQIAGDLLDDCPEGVIATGFLVGGPSDQAAIASSSPALRNRARQDEMEEMVALVGQTVLGLTVNCARCHDHKFDPIPQQDYYRMKAALDGVMPGDRDILSNTLIQQEKSQREQLRLRIAALTEEIRSIETTAETKLIGQPGNHTRAVAPTAYAGWVFSEGGMENQAGLSVERKGGAAIKEGALKLGGEGMFAVSLPLKRQLREKTLEAWVSIDDLNQRGGSVITVEKSDGSQFDAVVFGEQEPGRWMAGSELFHRTKSAEGVLETSKPTDKIQVAITYSSGGTISLYRNGTLYGKPYKGTGQEGGLQTYQETVSHVLFGLRHTGSNGYFRGKIYAAKVYDHALTPSEMKASFVAGYQFWSEAEIISALSPTESARRNRCKEELEIAGYELLKASNPKLVYAAVSTNPPATYVLNRGDYTQPRHAVSAGGISAVTTMSADFKVATDATDRDRRIHFAEWLVNPANPLTPRVMANRIWMYHFGNGIVNTPNDFGFNGDRPSNQPLLDWLAVKLQSGVQGAKPWSLKAIHRIIMLSSTYQQSSSYNNLAAKIDVDDRLFWRFMPHRLEGEAIRDAMLAVSGQLNMEAGGPSFQPFEIQNFGSSFYIQNDKDDPKFNRRSIYRINVQSAKSPFLAALDCPDPSAKAPKRTVSTTAIQALELMNNSFVIRQSKRFSQRIKAEVGEVGGNKSLQVSRAFELALGRLPTAKELRKSQEFLAKNSLDDLCWSLLNSTEFLYVR